MNVRSFVAAIAVAFAIAGSGLAASAQSQMQAQPAAAPVSGTWNVSATGTHFRSGPYKLSQVNDTVVGTNAAGGQMHGTMKSGGLVEGTWRGPSGETGWFNMQLTPDGKAFSGKYGYGGRKAEGSLIGHRST